MDANFWHERWQQGEIAFHEGRTNTLLSEHLVQLGLAPRSRIFVPLCGKSRDIAWLRAQGFAIAGVELSEMAVAQLFDEMDLEADVVSAGNMLCYRAEDIEIWVGDFFDLGAQPIGEVHAIYDRAALVALPPAMRSRYAEHLIALSGRAPQLLISFEYDQARMDGPPFSVPEALLHRLYAEHYDLQALEYRRLEGGLRSCDALECAWLLRPGR